MSAAERNKRKKLAARVHALLQKNPVATVADLARDSETDEALITQILDEHTPEDGYAHVGPGKGGGWVPTLDTSDEG